MAILTVGTGKTFATIAKAVAAAQSGDTIQINAGTYVAQDLKLTQDLTIEAAGNGPVVVTEGSYVTKGLFVAATTGNSPDITIEGLTFQNAHATSANGGNGAGVRYQGGNLTLLNDTFKNNQNGILATPLVANTGTIIVQGSTFNHNGASNGMEHNLYIGHVSDLAISNSLIENAVVGHEIKSRAFNNEIVNNVIMDGPTGTSSYSIDIPNGGNAVVQGNTIEQGPKSQNPGMIAYGEEGGLQPGSLTVAGNLIVNDLTNGSGIWNHTTIPATITGNEIFNLPGTKLLSGPAALAGNTTLAVEPAIVAAAPGPGPSMAFLGAAAASQFTFATGADVTAPPPTGIAPVLYQADITGTGTLTISDFRVGTDSIQLGQGVTITSETVSSGTLNIALSNRGAIVVPGVK